MLETPLCFQWQCCQACPVIRNFQTKQKCLNRVTEIERAEKRDKTPWLKPYRVAQANWPPVY